MHAAIIPDDTRDLSPALLRAGHYVPPPAAVFAATTPAERAMFGHVRGMYVLPTAELVDWLQVAIGNEFAVEIGAGVGVLARALGIMATDSHMQSMPAIAEIYRRTGQPTIAYGANVERIDADTVAREVKPDVILGAWITHRYNPEDHAAGGNMLGPDFDVLLANCRRLILICNTRTHAAHPLLRQPHERITPPWLYSRAMGGEDFIGIWKGNRDGKKTRTVLPAR